MLTRTIFTGILGASLALAAPLYPRQTKIDEQATAEAQQRDDTATRAFTGSEIKTGDGRCLSIDPQGGDFRENLIPIQVLTCDGSDNQKWDVITAGKHNNQPGNALVVSSLTNGCLNFDPRRAAGNQVLLFSCGGRADGGGETTDSQLFPFDGKAGPLALAPKNSQNKVCLTVKGNTLDQANCDPNTASNDQLFTIGDAGAQAPAPPPTNNSGSSGNQTDNTGSTGQSNNSTDSTACQPPLASTVTVTVSATGATAPQNTEQASATQAPATTTASGAKATGTAKLDEAAVKEAHVRDDTATRAFSGVQVKTSDGQCLNVDPLSGDFRENLIPITIGACDGSDNQKFDVITQGKHNNVDGAALIVSSLTQGCLNFDDRRADGNKVLLFSCGGRADGGGLVTDSQLFTFDAANKNAAIPLAPQNAKTSCMINKNGNLDIAQCDNAGDQLFSFVA
ncbi:hypothetical protein V5O48_003301 [Marasmius crinis-equi]|uniref:Ricin B lectin domain-containing protein n=1 Tax=Marasmius crinis-equi TaxID=585013 RepID=A0ABR3FU02_9AGAR